MSFWLGYFLGIISLIILLPIFSKLLMKWFVKRQSKLFLDNINNQITQLNEKLDKWDSDLAKASH